MYFGGWLAFHLLHNFVCMYVCVCFMSFYLWLFGMCDVSDGMVRWCNISRFIVVCYSVVLWGIV